MCGNLHGMRHEDAPLWCVFDGLEGRRKQPVGSSRRRLGGVVVGDPAFQAVVGSHAIRPSRSVADRGPLFGGHDRPERLDGVVEPGLGGPDGDLESFGRLARSQADVEIQDEDRLLRSGEPPKSALELVAVGECRRAIRLGRFIRQDRDLGTPPPAVTADVACWLGRSAGTARRQTARRREASADRAMPASGLLASHPRQVRYRGG